jgi:hypothetical protein
MVRHVLFPADHPIEQKPCADQDRNEDYEYQHVYEAPALFGYAVLVDFFMKRALSAPYTFVTIVQSR